ncbi:MAG TPA: AbrB/MazE/SpoVT family DNA-binding domain-containing protein [Patescibacteria group bacterium]|nr:AbrB/MazE/SpoVT family DNA-binding domain-containing protein [Patescibacteria group bacterium]
MTYTVSITSQGQINIPSKIRQELGLSKKRKALVSIENGKMVIEPVKDFLELAGSLKTNKKPLSNQELDDFIGNVIAREYTEKRKQTK